MNEGGRRFDPLALAVVGGALVLLVALVAGFVLSLRSAPPAAPSAPAKAAPAGPSLGERLSELTRQVAKEITDAVREDRPMKMPGTAKPPPATAKPPSGARPNLPAPGRPPAGMTWTYRVSIDPPVWRDATLAYRTVSQIKGLAVYAEFRHAAGKTNFLLGTFEPGHPSHAAVRFPGFFFHPAYFMRPLHVGQYFTWDWPWQLPDGAVRAGRIKRYHGEVVAWENLKLPGGLYQTARIEATLEYIEGSRVAARAKETLWYSYNHGAVAKVVREGATPDESASRIEAELVEWRQEKAP